MNLEGYGWVTGDFYKEVVRRGDQEGTYWWVRSREMIMNGDDTTLPYSTNEIVEYVQKDILDEIDELGYADCHQDWDRRAEVIQTLLRLRGYLVDGNE